MIMSSEEGTIFLQYTSDETFEHVCDPCHHLGIQKEATHFCNNCQEKFCRHCADSHSGQKISRNHKIVSVGEIARRIVSKQASICRVMCECSQKLEVAIYCQVHDDVICLPCSVVKHRMCQTVSLDEKGDAYVQTNIPILEQKAKILIAEIDKVMNENKSNHQRQESLKQKAKHDISEFRHKVVRQLDLMEQQILKELDERDSEKRQEIDLNISSCTTVKQLLQTDLKLINDVFIASNSVEKFAADIKISKRLTECERLLQDIKWETKSSSMTFKRNEQLFDMLEKIDVIGTLTEEAVYLDQPTGRSFSDLKIDNINQVDIKLTGDQGTSVITGCVFLPDERVVLCEDIKRKVKQLSKSFTLQGSLNLQARPWAISVVNDSTVIVTLPGRRQLQYIAVVPRLKPGRVLQLDKDCYGVEVANGDIYVTCHKGALLRGEGEVRILDQDGKLKRSLGLNHDGTFMFRYPNYLTVNIKSNKIYVSDSGRATVTCLKSDGTVVYEYPALCRPRGVCVDDDDNIIVCSYDSNTVHMVTAAGQNHKILLTDKEGIVYPQPVAYRHTDDTLIIGCRGTLLICKVIRE